MNPSSKLTTRLIALTAVTGLGVDGTTMSAQALIRANGSLSNDDRRPYRRASALNASHILDIDAGAQQAPVQLSLDDGFFDFFEGDRTGNRPGNGGAQDLVREGQQREAAPSAPASGGANPGGSIPDQPYAPARPGDPGQPGDPAQPGNPGQPTNLRVAGTQDDGWRRGVPGWTRLPGHLTGNHHSTIPSSTSKTSLAELPQTGQAR